MPHVNNRICPFSRRVVVAVLAMTCSLTWMVLAQQTRPATAPAPAPATGPATTPAVPLITGDYPGQGLTFQYPQTWTRDSVGPEQSGGPIIYLQEGGGIMCYWSVAVRKVPADEPLQRIVDALAHGMSRRYAGFKLREKSIVTAADGTRRGVVEYEYEVDPGVRGVQRQVLMPAGDGRLINATEAGSLKRWQRDSAVLKQITDSIRPVEGAR